MENQRYQNLCLTSLKDLTLPDVCPRCSRPAAATVKIRRYGFEEPTTGELVYAGIIGQILKFFIGGLESQELFQAKTCTRCANLSMLFRVLDWVFRLGAVVLVFILMKENSTPARPLIQRGIGVQLMVFSPLVIGAILAYISHRLQVLWKGIIWSGQAEKGSNSFKVRSTSWVSEFVRLNPQLSNQAADIFSPVQ